MKYDQVSLDRISKLHPKIRAEVLTLFKKCYDTINVPIRIVQGLRTIAEQDALYVQGRTKPGNIVTNARGGDSNHNYGLSFDFCLLNDNGISWDVNIDRDKDGQKDWWEVIKLFEAAGYEAGAKWKSFTDLPHIQKTFNFTTARLKEKVRMKIVDAKGYVII